MSQKTKRGSTSIDEKEKSRSDTPVKEMKKKVAANAEKERAAAEKEAPVEQAKSEQSKTPALSKPDSKPQSQNKPDQSKTPTLNKPEQGKAPQNMPEQSKTPQNKPEQSKTPQNKPEQSKTPQNKPELSKSPQNKPEQSKTPAQTKVEKSKDSKVQDIPLPAAKSDERTDKPKAPEPTEKPKQNGSDARQAAANGSSNGGAQNGGGGGDELEDEQFPELAYDDTSDDGGRGTPAPGRSATRRDQVKATRTPETPRPGPASLKLGNGDDKPTEESAPPAEAPKPDTKLLKLREEFSASPMRLRSSDRSTPDPTTPVVAAAAASEEKELDGIAEAKNEDESVGKKDTNFSKSRIKISPYRRSSRLQDSMLANYTGNNTTMEMDITESFTEQPSTSEEPPADASYARSLRCIRGRRSYKPAAEMSLRSVSTRPIKTAPEGVSRPTVHVVGRKRKPLDDEDISDRNVERAEEAMEAPGAAKRMRLLERVVTPFASLVRRRTVASSTPLPARRSQPIVGINTDLPLHAAAGALPPALLHPESLKTSAEPPPLLPAAAVAEVRGDKHNRCLIM